MDRKTFEKQKPFAGEKKPSMLRRCVGHDYTARRMYMVTMVTEGRKPLFGKVVGRSEVENKKGAMATGERKGAETGRTKRAPQVLSAALLL